MDIQVISSGSKGNCYKVSNKDTTLLIECGIPYKKMQEALDFKVAEVDGVLVSHEHMDHAKACKDLIKAGVDIYTSKGTAEALGIDGYRVKMFKIIWDKGFTYKHVKIGSFYVSPFSIIHDAKQPTGFYILDANTKESLLFLTDTQYCPFKFNPDYVMIEVNYVGKTINSNKNLDPMLRKRIKENHMSLETALDFMEKCNLDRLKKVYVMHLSEKNSDEEIIKARMQEVTGVSVEIC